MKALSIGEGKRISKAEIIAPKSVANANLLELILNAKPFRHSRGEHQRMVFTFGLELLTYRCNRLSDTLESKTVSLASF